MINIMINLYQMKLIFYLLYIISKVQFVENTALLFNFPFIIYYCEEALKNRKYQKLESIE